MGAKTKQLRKKIKAFFLRKEHHFIWVNEPVTGLGYLLYLPFRDYGCQVLIRVIRVKNVISFQRYFEQIPLISFLKSTQRGGADYMELMGFCQKNQPICPGQNFQITAKNSVPLAGLVQKTAGFQLFSLLPSTGF